MLGHVNCLDSTRNGPFRCSRLFFCNYIVPHLSFFPVTVASTKGNGSYGKWFCV